MKFFKEYKIKKLGKKLAGIRAETKIYQEVAKQVESLPPYVVDTIARNTSKIAQIEFELEELKK